MIIFLDTSKRRRIYFRSLIVCLSAIAIFVIIYFVFNIFFGKSAELPPVKYSDTVYYYHYYYSAANKNKIAITFDDGPRPKITEELMDILNKNKVPATFFFIGQEMLLQPNIVAEASQRGFDIGSHSFTHSDSVHSSQNRLALELRASGYLISKITGKEPLFYRPPFLLGIGIDPTVNPYIPVPKDVLWSLEDGFIPVGTDIDPQDWTATSPKKVIAGIETTLINTSDKHILLLHEEENTILALQDIIDELKNKGYSIVSLKDLLIPPKEIALSNALKFGSTDAATSGEVSKLQWFLFMQGDLDPYMLTGTFDQATRNALISFQLRNKLIDPNNVNPARAGIADQATREKISKVSYLAPPQPQTPANKPLKENKNFASVWFVSSAISSYINFVPFVRNALIFMTEAALALVIFRCLFIAVVFVIRWGRSRFKHSKNPTKEEKKFRGVSVLIPAYNEEENIRSTIESVIRSTYSRKEIIVIDDGSTDNTVKIVQTVINKNPCEPIKLLSIKNGGKANALNHGIEISRFDICVVIDADAVLSPDSLFYFMRHFRDPSVGAVAGRVKTTSDRGFLNLFQNTEYAIGQNLDKKVLSTMSAVGVVPGPAGAWDKKSVIEAGGFNTETLVEDQDMTLSLLRMGKKIIYEERAISYTETPDTVVNFLKQRFRWVYGTTQCFWKNKRVFIERPFSTMSLVVMPNIFLFNIILPLTYPFADLAFLTGIIFGQWQSMLAPFLLFTLFDLIYAAIGLWKEPNRAKLLLSVPVQRISYRQLIYYTIIRSVVRAIEGTGSGWNKFAKSGETQRFYFSALERAHLSEQVEPVAVSSPWIDGAVTTNNNYNEN